MRWWCTDGRGWTRSPPPAPTDVWEVQDRKIVEYQVSPQDFHIRPVALDDVLGGDAKSNAESMRAVLGGKTGPLTGFVTINAAAGLLAADEAPTFAEGVSRAAECIDDGRALRKLERFVEVSQRIAGSAVAEPSTRNSILDQIVAATEAEVVLRRQSTPETFLRDLAEARPPPRDLRGALRRSSGALLAEVKKGSPSKGPFAIDLDHVAIARQFRDGGAVAISVLTAPAFYADNLELDEVATALRADERSGGPACPPLLRKEFHIDRYQVLEARSLGADGYLLTREYAREARVAGPHPVRRLARHDRVRRGDGRERSRGSAGSGRRGGDRDRINNRDLHTFVEDLSTTERLRPLIPPEIPVVAASGVRTRADLERVRACHVNAVLIGEALCTAADPAGAIRDLFGE